jgi:hypothetical protein
VLDWARNRRQYVIHMLATRKSRSNTLRLFLWGYVKDKFFVPPVPVTLDDRITAATAGVDEDMLTGVWQ